MLVYASTNDFQDRAAAFGVESEMVYSAGIAKDGAHLNQRHIAKKQNSFTPDENQVTTNRDTQDGASCSLPYTDKGA